MVRMGKTLWGTIITILSGTHDGIDLHTYSYEIVILLFIIEIMTKGS